MTHEASPQEVMSRVGLTREAAAGQSQVTTLIALSSQRDLGCMGKAAEDAQPWHLVLLRLRCRQLCTRLPPTFHSLPFLDEPLPPQSALC